MSKDYNTNFFEVGGEKFCAYCGKRLKAYTDYEEYTPHHYYHCDCEKANLQHERDEAVAKLNREYDSKLRTDWKLKRQVEYEEMIRDMAWRLDFNVEVTFTKCPWNTQRKVTFNYPKGEDND